MIAQNNYGSARIILVRHGRPQLDRNVGLRMDWREYRNWWQEYEASPLLQDQEAPAELLEVTGKAPFLFASPRPRALETAKAIAANREIRVDPVFIEAPMPPPHLPLWFRFRPVIWNTLARTCWLFGFANGEETLAQACIRAACVAETLDIAASSGSDVILVAHGWFNRMLGTPLWRRGWRCAHNSGDDYWAYRVYGRRQRLAIALDSESKQQQCIRPG